MFSDFSEFCIAYRSAGVRHDNAFYELYLATNALLTFCCKVEISHYYIYYILMNVLALVFHCSCSSPCVGK